ncbi:MAG: HEAT repeat domain-containing protein [Candidatus Korobacteraceae bacterium]
MTKATRSLTVMAAVCFVFSGALMAQGPQQTAWNILQSAATGTNSQQRVSAVTALALITSNPKAVTMAEQALQDQNVDVRQAAATTLGTLKVESAIPALQQALKDSSPAVVMAAAKSLVEMNNEEGYDTYYVVATGQMKSGGLVSSQEQKLNQLLHNPKDLAETAFEQGIGFVPFGGLGFGAFKMIHDSGENAIVVKATAFKMLAKDPDPKSEKALITATTDQQWVIRAAAYDALSKRGDPSVLPSIENGLTDQQIEVKLTAAAAIAQLSSLPK